MASMSFHTLLSNYVNGGCLHRADFKMALVAPRTVFMKNVTPVCLGYNSLAGKQGTNRVELTFDSYSGNDKRLLRLRRSLEPLKGDLVTVLLHGSCGDGRTTGYSDVDALVILRNEVFMDPVRLIRVGRTLSDACRHMFRYDPLQHHGWFAMSEADLSCYPEEVLPLEALEDARVLTGAVRLVIHRTDAVQERYHRKAIRHAEKLMNQLSSGWRPANAFQLKSLLSEFMMLPVLTVQALQGKGCSKRDSFTIGRSYFSESEWAVMDEVSTIRRDWNYRPNLLSCWVLTRPGFVFRKLRRRWPSRLRPSLQVRITDQLYADISEFLAVCISRLNQV